MVVVEGVALLVGVGWHTLTPLAPPPQGMGHGVWDVGCKGLGTGCGAWRMGLWDRA